MDARSDVGLLGIKHEQTAGSNIGRFAQSDSPPRQGSGTTLIAGDRKSRDHLRPLTGPIGCKFGCPAHCKGQLTVCPLSPLAAAATGRAGGEIFQLQLGHLGRLNFDCLGPSRNTFSTPSKPAAVKFRPFLKHNGLLRDSNCKRPFQEEGARQCQRQWRCQGQRQRCARRGTRRRCSGPRLLLDLHRGAPSDETASHHQGPS